MQYKSVSPFLENVLIILILSLCIVVWVDRWYLLRYEGNIKRGLKIWSKPLPLNNLTYLNALEEDVVELYFDDAPQKKAAFIRKSNQEVVINYRTLYTTSNLWAYVGYVDLRSRHPRLEFRNSFFVSLCSAIILFIMIFGYAPLWVIGISLIFLTMNSWYEAKMIVYFLDRETNYYPEKKDTSSLKVKANDLSKNAIKNK